MLRFIWVGLTVLVCLPAQSRFLSVDPMREFVNPYSYVGNNPITLVDPAGTNTFLTIWFSKDGETGHAGMAVENYVAKTVNGKETMVPDGTYTYYDLWPKKSVGKRELQTDVIPDYNTRIIGSLAELTGSDPSVSGKQGHVSQNGERRAPDGVIELPQGYLEDQKVMNSLKNLTTQARSYNACNFNCSTFVQTGITAVHGTFDANQQVNPPFPLNIMYKPALVVAPNNLFNAAASLPGAKVIKGPSTVKAKPYLEYFGK